MDLSSTIKRKAYEIGFSKIGIAKAEFHKKLIKIFGNTEF